MIRDTSGGGNHIAIPQHNTKEGEKFITICQQNMKEGENCERGQTPKRSHTSQKESQQLRDDGQIISGRLTAFL